MAIMGFGLALTYLYAQPLVKRGFYCYDETLSRPVSIVYTASEHSFLEAWLNDIQ